MAGRYPDRLQGKQNSAAQGGGRPSNPTDTAKSNFTESTWGTDKGRVTLGKIDAEGAVTSGIHLQASDGQHNMCMDNDGERKGWTSFITPGNFQVECGRNNEESNSSCMINAKNGNIHITAANGKIILQGTDIEFNAIGEGGSKGNIAFNATENISFESKKFMVNAKARFRIASPAKGEIVANQVLKLFGAMIKGISNGCAVKDSKTLHQKDQIQYTR